MEYQVYRIFAKILSLFGMNYKQLMTKFFRNKGMVIGEGCNILSNINTSEPFLISIGNDVTVSNDVDFITHDASIGKVTNGKTSDIFGPITIGDNCFIGAHSIIMYGVSLPRNTIVAAGSVVTRSFKEENTILGGCPAVKIRDWDAFSRKAKNRELSIKRLKFGEKKQAILDETYWIRK